MEKTRSDIVNTMDDDFSSLLVSIEQEVREAVEEDTGAEEYADEQGYADSDDNEIRDLLVAAYSNGRDTTLAALAEVIEEAKG